PLPLSTPIAPQSPVSKASTGGVATDILSGLASGAVRATKTEIKKYSPTPQSPHTQHQEDSRLTFLRPAYRRWYYLRQQYPLLEYISFEKFKKWLDEHPGIIHPVSRKLVTTRDWNDREAYDEYLELEKKKHERIEREHQKEE